MTLLPVHQLLMVQVLLFCSLILTLSLIPTCRLQPGLSELVVRLYLTGNLMSILFGVSESPQGTPRHTRSTQDFNSVASAFSDIEDESNLMCPVRDCHATSWEV